MSEKAVLAGINKSMVGIVTEPDEGPGHPHRPGLIVLNAGLLHRVGPNRLYVKLTRTMAAEGFCSLRFDFAGIGDSQPRRDQIPSDDAAVAETQEAIDFLGRTEGIEEVILLGVCSGANTAFRTALADDRVVGVAGINGAYLDKHERAAIEPHVQTRTQGRYYRRQLFRADKWWRLLHGRSDIKRLAHFVSTTARSLIARPEPVPDSTSLVENCRKLHDRNVEMLFLYSEGSTGLDLFRLVSKSTDGLLESLPRLRVEVVTDSDHLFTLLWSQKALLEVIRQWLVDEGRLWRTDRPEYKRRHTAVPRPETTLSPSGKRDMKRDHRS